MNKVLIIFASRNGHTKTIANDIAIILEQNEKTVELCNIDATSPMRELKSYKHILVMSPVYNKKFMHKVVDFVANNHDELNKVSSILVGVCLSVIKSKKQNEHYINNFLKRTRWNPNEIFILAGRLYYQDYGILEKILLKIMMFMYGEKTKTTEPIIFTDYQEVEKIAQKIINS